MRVTIGGCAYRSMVHVMHSQSVAYMVVALILNHHEAAFSYRHTSNLPQGRCLWLRARIASGDDIAVMVDSDTKFDPMTASVALESFAKDGAPIGIAPVIRDAKNGPALNIYSGHGRTVAPSECGGHTLSLWAGGFGFAAFNLAWFRTHWPLPFPEQFGEPEESIHQGEDIQFCRSVAKRNGLIRSMWIPTRHYDSTGHSFFGGSVDYRDGQMIID